MVRVIFGIVFITIGYLFYREYKRIRRLKEYEKRIDEADFNLEVVDHLDEAISKELETKHKVNELKKLQEEFNNDE
jgi:hypothetical protein